MLTKYKTRNPFEDFNHNIKTNLNPIKLKNKSTSLLKLKINIYFLFFKINIVLNWKDIMSVAKRKILVLLLYLL